MPAKSRNVKGKHPHHSKKSKAIQRQGMVSVKQETAVAASPSAVTAATAPLPRAVSGKSAALQYPYIMQELRRIGILAGIILVVLIVLAIILS